MRVLKNKQINQIPHFKQDTDDDSSLPFIPPHPLPKRGFMILSGAPASGKTSLLTSLLCSKPTKKAPKNTKFYCKYFDMIHVISHSLATLPLSRFKLPSVQLHDKYSDELLEKIVDDVHAGDNLNFLLLIDDCVRSLSRSKILCKIAQNRRHITQNSEKEGSANMSVFLTTQKYNAIPLVMRVCASHVILYKTNNNAELRTIKDELMADLNPDEQEEVLDLAWSEPYSFLYIDNFAQSGQRYYKKFDLIEI